MREPDLRLGDLALGKPDAMRARADRIDRWIGWAERTIVEARRVTRILRQGADSNRGGDRA